MLTPPLSLTFALQWQPTRQGYLNFLAESKVVYDTLERLVAEAPRPECEHLSQPSLVTQLAFRRCLLVICLARVKICKPSFVIQKRSQSSLATMLSTCETLQAQI